MLLQELGFPQKYAIIILNNSQGSFVLIRNPIHKLKKPKHIDIQHHYVRKKMTTKGVFFSIALHPIWELML
jgi:hypothetical protein